MIFAESFFWQLSEKSILIDEVENEIEIKEMLGDKNILK